MQPKFSIVVPVYNVAPYLRECLDSVLAQTFTDWEAICVDDGSTDGSGAILDEYAERDRRINVIHQENAGVSVARNVALDVAKGEYVNFLDGDDALDEGWLLIASEIVRRESPDLLRMSLLYWRGGARKHLAESNRAAQVLMGTEVRNWGWRTFSREGWSCLLFVRRFALSSGCRFPVGMRICEDNVFCLSLLPYLEKVCVHNYKGYFYRVRGDSAVHKKITADDCKRLIDEIVRQFVLQKGPAECSSGSISRIVCWWRKIPDSEDDAKAIVRKAVKDAKDAGALVWSFLPWWQRVGVCVFAWCGVTALVDVLLSLRKIYGKIRQMGEE